VKYFYDTEFYEDGERIHLISIGIVAEDGRELYLENTDFDPDIVPTGHFLVDNVFPWLYNTPNVLVPKDEIAELVKEFVLAVEGPHELWAYYADYDHVVLAQLYGAMSLMPKGFPWFTLDLKQVMFMNRAMIDDQIIVNPPPVQEGVEHHALADARWNRDLYKWLEEME
jgi:hypothetical protein